MAGIGCSSTGELYVVSGKHARRIQGEFTCLELLKSAHVVDTLLSDEEVETSTLTFVAPFEQAPAFFDGSAFLSHVERARRARGATMPASVLTTPLMYQGCAEYFLQPREPVALIDESFGLDIEAEIAVIVNDTPRGVSPQSADVHILGFVLLCDWTYRNLLPAEFQSGFGFIQSKPPSTLAPLVCLPSDLFKFKYNKGFSINVSCMLNDEELGCVGASEMHFSFAELIAHAARTRPLRAGTVIGSGTISHSDEQQGVCCLAERRALEMVAKQVPVTPYLKSGDRILMSASAQGENLFGDISVTISMG